MLENTVLRKIFVSKGANKVYTARTTISLTSPVVSYSKLQDMIAEVYVSNSVRATSHTKSYVKIKLKKT
jgi:hypothetical protein